MVNVMAASVAGQLGTAVFASGTATLTVRGSDNQHSACVCKQLSAQVPHMRGRQLAHNQYTPLSQDGASFSGRIPSALRSPGRRQLSPCAALQQNSGPPPPEEDIIGSLVGHLGLNEKEARALAGAMLDGVSKVMEKEYGDSEAQKFSSAFPDLTDWKATARDILTGDSGGSSRSGGGLGDVLGDILGGKEEPRKKSGGSILDDVFGGSDSRRDSRSSSGGGLGGKLGDILGDVLKGGGDERRSEREYEEPRYEKYDTKYDDRDRSYDSGYKKYDTRYEEEERRPSKKDSGGLFGGGIASTVGHMLLKSFLGVGELKLAVGIIKKLGVDPLQTMAFAYLLIKFVRGRVGPDIFGMILNKIPLFRLVMDDRNPVVGLVLGALKKAILR